MKHTDLDTKDYDLDPNEQSIADEYMIEPYVDPNNILFPFDVPVNHATVQWDSKMCLQMILKEEIEQHNACPAHFNITKLFLRLRKSPWLSLTFNIAFTRGLARNCAAAMTFEHLKGDLTLDNQKKIRQEAEALDKLLQRSCGTMACRAEQM